MNDEWDNFEAELRGLRPAEPPPRLHRAIAVALAGAAPAEGESSKRPRFQWRWAAYSALPIAAGLAVWLFSNSPPSSTRPIAGVGRELLKPVSAKDILYAAKDEGLVTLDDGIPARKQRLQYVGTMTWRDPKTNASLTWTIPREEVRVVPIRYE